LDSILQADVWHHGQMVDAEVVSQLLYDAAPRL
jgi:hypothetical protein